MKKTRIVLIFLSVLMICTVTDSAYSVSSKTVINKSQKKYTKKIYNKNKLKQKQVKKYYLSTRKRIKTDDIYFYKKGKLEKSVKKKYYYNKKLQQVIHTFYKTGKIKKGSTQEIRNYDKKGKLSLVIKYKYLSKTKRKTVFKKLYNYKTSKSFQNKKSTTVNITKKINQSNQNRDISKTVIDDNQTKSIILDKTRLYLDQYNKRTNKVLLAFENISKDHHLNNRTLAEFYSSNPSIATIDSYGWIRIHKSGTVTFTAKGIGYYQNKVEDANLTVNLEYNPIELELQKIRDKTFELANKHRVSQGRTPLKIGDQKMQDFADLRAKEIAEFFSHDRPRGLKPYYSGENIQYQYDAFDNNESEDKILRKYFDSWYNSPGHNKNMSETFYTHSTIGLYYDHDKDILYAVQLFHNNTIYPRVND